MLTLRLKYFPFRQPRSWLPTLLLAGVLLPGLGLLVAPAFLCVAAPTQKADVIILLGGEDGSRVEGAATLFNAGWAPHVIITGEDDMYRRQLIRLGVPETAIWVDALARSTAENARFSISIMREHDCKSALIVTSWYHTRRAIHCFQHYAPESRILCPTDLAVERGGQELGFACAVHSQGVSQNDLVLAALWSFADLSSRSKLELF